MAGGGDKASVTEGDGLADLKEWLFEEVADDNDIVVDEMQTDFAEMFDKLVCSLMLTSHFIFLSCLIFFWRRLIFSYLFETGGRVRPVPGLRFVQGKRESPGNWNSQVEDEGRTENHPGEQGQTEDYGRHSDLLVWRDPRPLRTATWRRDAQV